MARVWLVRAGTSGEYSDGFRECGCISIGFGLVDDLTDIDGWPDIRSALYKSHDSVYRHTIDQVWWFLWTIQPGDLILTPIGQGVQQVMVGTASADRPWFDPRPSTNGRHHLRRRVDWTTDLLEIKESVYRRYRAFSLLHRTVTMIAENDLDFWLHVAESFQDD